MSSPVLAVIASDLHAHTSHPMSRPLANGRSSRFQDLLDVWAQVDALVEQHSPPYLLILGDLYHRRHFINFALYNDLQAALVATGQKVSRRTIVLVGNHDIETAAAHALAPYRYVPGWTVIDEPMFLPHGLDAVMIPYSLDPEPILAALAKTPGYPAFLHYAAEGAPLEGDYWLPSPLSMELLAERPLTVFGHIHKPSALLDGRVVYVGAPLHFDFGDVGPRYAWLLREDWTMEAVPLAAPQFVTAKWPRVSTPPDSGGYLRILGVPEADQVGAREAALASGWLDVVTEAALLSQEIRSAITERLVLDRDTLQTHVATRCPDLTADEQSLLTDEGFRLLREARQ